MATKEATKDVADWHAKNNDQGQHDDYVPIELLQPMEHVDNNGWYRVTIQIGARRRWRKYGGGRVRNIEIDAKRTRQLFVASVHATDPIDGRTVNGLIESHNKWLQANHEHSMPHGHPIHMLAVTDVEACDKPEATTVSGRTQSALERGVDALAKVADKLGQAVEKLASSNSGRRGG